MVHAFQETTTYRVQVGHAEVCVTGRSVQEAIQLARRKLSIELPRLYDVIQSMDESQFRVQPAA